MQVPTIPGHVYAITASSSCIVSAVSEDGTLTPVFSISSPGQYTIIAPSVRLDVGDSHALVTPARGRVTPGTATDTPRLQFACTETLQTVNNPNNNYNAFGFSLPVEHSGRLKHISLRARNTGAINNTSLWLKIWTMVNGTFRFRGISENSDIQTLNTFSRWNFPGITVSVGEILAFTFHREKDKSGTEWGSFTTGYMRVKTGEERNAGCFQNTNNPPSVFPCFPECTLGLDTVTGIQAAGRPLSFADELASHAANTSLHLFLNEHDSLAELLSRKDDLLALLNPSQEQPA